MPSSSSRSATRSTTVWVSETVRNTRTSGCSRWNSQRRSGHRDRRRPGGRPQDEIAGDGPLARRSDVGDELILEREQALRAAIEPQAGLGGLDPPAGAVEELRPKPLLERPDLKRDRGLRDAEPFRRLREAAPLDDRAEGRELLRVHNRSLYVGLV